MSRNLYTQHRLKHNYTQSLDYYPTPGWATRAFMEFTSIKPSGTVLEPACGAHHMALVLHEYGLNVTATDITEGYDFLKNPPTSRYDWVITNPPFAKAKEFVETALPLATAGVAVLVRLNFLASIQRATKLFIPIPPSEVLVFAERIGFKYGVAEPNVPTATDFCWVVWRPETTTTRLIWIPPCKTRLSQDKDWF